MSVAVFSADAVLARMLELEAKRCGLQPASPDVASVWLLDLDHPPALPRHGTSALRIGFSAHVTELPPHVDVLLPLPMCARVLERTLRQRMARPITELRREEGAIWLSGKKLHFSKTEQQLLGILTQNHHRVVTLAELAAAIGDSAEKSNAVAVYLYRLRHKLEADGMMRIRTVRGIGYQWMGD